MKRALSLMLLAAFLVVPIVASAGVPPKVLAAVLEAYPPAQDHRALHTAYEQPDPAKMRGFAVVEKGGIPAERARFYISWSDYDYRGAVVRVGDGDGISTRRGGSYTYLKRGDVMAVAGVKEFNRTIYLKLLSSDVYVPENRAKEKHHSRVTVMLGFDFPKEVLDRDDAGEVLRVIGEWVKPFGTLKAAEAYAEGLIPPAAAPALADGKRPPAALTEKERMKALEEKIDAARRDLDSAEKELGVLKRSKSE
ncbi:MAG: hypothetical protein JXA24_05245 [Proteobacteria bacterium]|nr:hypothetical protein [Pseudomonadota bacterium]